MTSKERIKLALAHKEADRIPMDFGSFSVTGINYSCVAALREYYGLEKHPIKIPEPFIPLLIESGFDVLNPVQCSATGMDPVTLKEKYGKDIVFWGGGIDTQKLLPFGTPDQVREQVKQRCEIFGRDGGFVFNSIHNLQANTPIDNLVAMIETAKEFGAI